MMKQASLSMIALSLLTACGSATVQKPIVDSALTKRFNELKPLAEEDTTVRTVMRDYVRTIESYNTCAVTHDELSEFVEEIGE